jgi:hypothetical protein
MTAAGIATGWGLLFGLGGLAAPALAASGPVIAPVPYVLFFLLASLVVAVVTAAIRDQTLPEILTETRKFFVTIVLVIGFFAALVFVLEWIFVRPLI